MELGLLAPGGVLAADNALKRGLVADRSERNPALFDHGEGAKAREEHVKQAEWLDEFNRAVQAEERVENVLLPCFDGVNLVRLKGGRTGTDGKSA